jgi:hypothetical protein
MRQRDMENTARRRPFGSRSRIQERRMRADMDWEMHGIGNEKESDSGEEPLRAGFELRRGTRRDIAGDMHLLLMLERGAETESKTRQF